MRTDGQVSLRPCCSMLDSTIEPGAGCSQAWSPRALTVLSKLRMTGRATSRAPYPPQDSFCLQSYLFLNKKTRRLYHQRKRPAKIAWTVTYRKQHRKVSSGGCMRSTCCSGLLTCRQSCLLAAGLRGGWACCAQQALLAAGTDCCPSCGCHYVLTIPRFCQATVVHSTLTSQVVSS